MFGIGGGELFFILFIALMLFGSDKIPTIARTLGKAMAQLKNATNEIKSEIQKSAEENGVDTSIKELTSSFTKQIDEVKAGIDPNSITTFQKEIEDIETVFNTIQTDRTDTQIWKWFVILALLFLALELLIQKFVK